MTTQEAYERMREFFSRAGAQLAFGPNRECRYRTEGGRKCAVGCLIPDDMYDSSLEGKGVEQLVDPGLRQPNLHLNPCAGIAWAQVATLLQAVDVEFLKRAQMTHDRKSCDAADFVAKLDRLAVRFNLTVVQ